MESQRTPIIYETKDPNQKGITFVAIQTETQPPYVFGTYSARDREDIPRLGTDMLVIPIAQAKRLFDFQKGNIAELVR